MTKEWVRKKNEEYNIKTSIMKFELADKVRKLGYIPEDAIQIFLNKLVDIETIAHDPELSYIDMLDGIYDIDPLKHIQQIIDNIVTETDDNDLKVFFDMLELREDISRFRYRSTISSPYNSYLDSDPVKFDGTIIITDPCYIRKPDDDYDIEQWGCTSYLYHTTIYGDWSCATFNSDTDEVLGEFCADGAAVGVFLLEEVLKYNSEFDYHQTRKWTTTTIENFYGTVQIVVKEPDDGKGDYNVHVVGKGVDKVTGKPLNFITMQTGF